MLCVVYFTVVPYTRMRLTAVCARPAPRARPGTPCSRACSGGRGGGRVSGFRRVCGFAGAHECVRVCVRVLVCVCGCACLPYRVACGRGCRACHARIVQPCQPPAPYKSDEGSHQHHHNHAAKQGANWRARVSTQAQTHDSEILIGTEIKRARNNETGRQYPECLPVSRWTCPRLLHPCEHCAHRLHAHETYHSLRRMARLNGRPSRETEKA